MCVFWRDRYSLRQSIGGTGGNAGVGYTFTIWRDGHRLSPSGRVTGENTGAGHAFEMLCTLPTEKGHMGAEKSKLTRHEGLYGTSQSVPVFKETYLDQNTINRPKKGSPASPWVPGTRSQSDGIVIVSRSEQGAPAATLAPGMCARSGGIYIISQPAWVAPAVEPGTLSQSGGIGIVSLRASGLLAATTPALGTHL